MLIYNFQMGGSLEGNSKMINVPIKIEIKDNNQIPKSSTQTDSKYKSQKSTFEVKLLIHESVANFFL